MAILHFRNKKTLLSKKENSHLKSFLFAFSFVREYLDTLRLYHGVPEASGRGNKLVDNSNSL
jgi:hypothetical protein